MKQQRIEVKVSLGEHEAAFTVKGRSTTMLANILGREVTEEGVETVWLDRLVHRPEEDYNDGWCGRGALSTVLTRTVRAALPEPAPTKDTV